MGVENDDSSASSLIIVQYFRLKKTAFLEAEKARHIKRFYAEVCQKTPKPVCGRDFSATLLRSLYQKEYSGCKNSNIN